MRQMSPRPGFSAYFLRGKGQSMKYYVPSPRALGVVLSLLVLAGCSSSKKRFVVEGAVSYRGQPLSSGRIWFFMTDGRAAMSSIHDGTFTVTDVFPGEARAAVTTQDISAARMRMRKAQLIAKNKDAAPPTPRPQAAAQSVSTFS